MSRIAAAIFTIMLGGVPCAVAQEFQMQSFLPPEPAFQAQANTREEQLYKQGTSAVDAEDWQAALEAFNAVTAIRGRRADAALYWKAYTLNKVGRRGDALNTVAELRKQYPNSNWLKDAGALEIEIRKASGQRPRPESQEDEELKLLALNSLMDSDPGRAMPHLEKLLQSNSSARVKDRALFVLAQSESPRAKQLVGNIARGQSGPALQKKAIEYLAVHEGDKQLFKEIYASSNNKEVKRAVMHAFLISDDEESLLAVAKQETDPELRRHAAHQLGAMDATDALRQLLQTWTSPEDKREVIQAMGIAGEVSALGEVARTATDPYVRKAAIRALGIAGGDQSRNFLLGVYTSEKDREVRRAVVEALFIQDEAKTLVDLARKETDPEMRRALVEKLAIMDEREAKDYMLELLNK